MADNDIDDDDMVTIHLSMLVDILSSSNATTDGVPTDTFPKSSKTDQRTKFSQLLNSSLNPHLCEIRQNLIIMLNNNRSSFEIVLFLNAHFENSLRNTIYFCFHRLLHCDDKALKEWLPHFRLDIDSFVSIIEKIVKNSDIYVDINGKQISIQHAAKSQLMKLFPRKSELAKASVLAIDFLQARNVRHQIIHGSRIGRTQAKDWAKLTNITEAQSYRACIATFSMLEEFDEVASALFFKPQESSFNPFQPDMRGKSEAGARANEHQTKLILESCGVRAPIILKDKDTS